MTDDEVLAVAALAERAEIAFGFPQDIEWALEGGTLHLLQSRPVTRFPARWTRDESAERFPDAITPLTWDYTAPGFHASLAHSLALMGLPPIETSWFERIDGYVYGNATAISLYTRFGELDVPDLDTLAARLPALRTRFGWVAALPGAWAADLDRYLVAIGRVSAVDPATLDTAGLAAHLARVDRIGCQYFLPNIAISITQGLLYRALHRLVALALGPRAAGPMLAELTGFCDTRTHRVNAELDALAALAREDTPLAGLLASTIGADLVGSDALGAHPVFADAFAAFLDDHGHRETHFDAIHPTWGEAPGTVLDLLRPMLAGGDASGGTGSDERTRRARRSEAEARLLSALPEALRRFAAELARLAREYTALDDLEHYQTTRLTPPFRRALLEVGRRLIDAGACENASEVFFLRRTTLEGWLAGGVDVADAADEIRTLRAEHERHGSSEPAWFLDADDGEESDSADASEDAALARGVAGSPGLIEAEVCIVRTPEDFARFRPGSILVARTTNPAWTPLFRTASAVVTECGGPLSHGAVTARECGIPAVLAVRGALDRLADGMRAIVDGGRGTVRLVESGAR